MCILYWNKIYQVRYKLSVWKKKWNNETLCQNVSTYGIYLHQKRKRERNVFSIFTWITFRDKLHVYEPALMGFVHTDLKKKLEKLNEELRLNTTTLDDLKDLEAPFTASV